MRSAVFVGLLAILSIATTVAVAAEPIPTGGFKFELVVELPGSPAEVYAAATGDISGWWDHSMAVNPVSLTIEARPGGHFLEVMDKEGGGVVHATVTQAQFGKMLRMVGPLGLAGHAIHMVTTWTLEPLGGERTKFVIEVHASGEIHEGWDAVIEKTWRHFIEGQLKGFLEARPRQG
jgi:uncharacterized protein YndB with AHSA1/START domain